MILPCPICGRKFHIETIADQINWSNHLLDNHMDWQYVTRWTCACGQEFRYKTDMCQHFLDMSDEERERHFVMLKTAKVME